jgi:hypothetical protein
VRRHLVWCTALEEPAVEIVAQTGRSAAEKFVANRPGIEGEVTVVAGVLGRIYRVGPDGIRWVESMAAVTPDV